MKKLKNCLSSPKNVPFAFVFLAFVVVASVTVTSKVYAQSAKINSYLRMIAEGKIEDVKLKLPDLIATYGEEPGVLLLQGAILDDASKAVPHYKKILEKFPNSEWAAHAAWRLVQYYSIVSDTTTAKKALENFRIKYPNSPFLAAATEAVRLSLSDAKYKNRDNYLNPPKAENQKKTTTKVGEIDDKNKISVTATKEKYGLQVGIYSTRAAAESECERLKKTAKMRTEVLEKVVVGEKKFSVVVGNYNSEEEALEAKTYVERECKCNPLVFKK